MIMFLCLNNLINMALYTFIFEIAWRVSDSGKMKPYEYRKIPQMTVADARAYARRLSSIQNVIYVLFYKQMY
jgi:hypothetical protein